MSRCCSWRSPWTRSCADTPSRTASPGGVRGQGHAPRPSPFDLLVGSILAMADTQQVDAKAERTAAKLARRIGAFSKAHGGAEGQVAHIGERGARIVLVGED